MVSVATAAAILGIGTRTAYDLIERGEFPVKVQTVGRRMKVSRLLLDRFVAGDAEPAA